MNTYYTEEDICRLLLGLGINPRYKGYRYTIYALLLAQEDAESMEHVTKFLYPAIANKYTTTNNSIDRCIRTVSEIAWKKNPERIEAMMGCSMTKNPTASEFLKMIYSDLY